MKECGKCKSIADIEKCSICSKILKEKFGLKIVTDFKLKTKNEN